MRLFSEKQCLTFLKSTFLNAGSRCIVVKMTAAETPSSNGLCKRHNEVLSEKTIKTRADAK